MVLCLRFPEVASSRRNESATTALRPPESVGSSGPGENRSDKGVRDDDPSLRDPKEPRTGLCGVEYFTGDER